MPTRTEIKVELLHDPVRHLAFFNQFGIHRTGDLVELHFAFGKSPSDTFGGIIIVVTKDVLERQKDGFLKYLKQIELPHTSVSGNSRVREPKEVLFADFLGLARHGEIAEIACHAINWKAAIDSPEEVKSGKKDTSIGVKAQCVAVQRSDLEIHRNWISLLYEDEA